MRTSSEIDKCYQNLILSMAEVSKNHIEGTLQGYEMNQQEKELDKMSSLLFCFETSWLYLEDTVKDKLCDIASKFNFNQSWE